MEAKRAVIPAVFALAAAGFYLAALTGKERAIVGNYEMARVLAARMDIPERTLLKESMFEAIEVPRRYMAQDAIEVRTPSDFKAIVNQVNRTRILKGNQVGQSALISLSPEAGLSLRVPPGYRGAVLPIDNELKTLVKPGDHVDVLVTFDAVQADGRREKATATLLQNILVIGVGSNLGQGLTAKQFGAAAEAEQRASAFSEKAMISVALNPKELQYLALAGKQGEVSIGIRAPGDNVMYPIEIATIGRLMGR